jgi:hypothetical protein
VTWAGFTDEGTFGWGVFEVGFDILEEIVRPVVPVFSFAGFI